MKIILKLAILLCIFLFVGTTAPKKEQSPTIITITFDINKGTNVHLSDDISYDRLAYLFERFAAYTNSFVSKYPPIDTKTYPYKDILVVRIILVENKFKMESSEAVHPAHMTILFKMLARKYKNILPDRSIDETNI